MCLEARRLRQAKTYGDAAPHWNKFADDTQGDFQKADNPAFIKAKEQLQDEPPKLQKYVPPDGVKWDDEKNGPRPDEHVTRYVLRLVRDVRNNLFHGGKYPDGGGGPISGESLRNANLLKACLTILHTCKSFDSRVESEFEQAQ